MDGGAAIATVETRAGRVEIEQAIFTSIRSPMGAGYRIVAASRGITADEKREIVQCAPSHGSLCDPSPDATGLASFILRSGRHCLFFSGNAGKEDTGRGGYRIHTHVLVLDPDAYGAFHFDPFEVEAVVTAIGGHESSRTPPTRLEPLSLCCKGAAAVDSSTVEIEGDLAKQTARVALALIRGDCTLVTGVPDAREVSRAALGATPAGQRRRLSVSYGLKYSPRRSFDLALTEVSAAEVERIKRDNEIQIIDWKNCTLPTDDPYENWLGFARRLWAQGRGATLRQLSAGLNEHCIPELLSRIVALHDDIEQVGAADRATLAVLRMRHLGESGVSELHVRLLKTFHQAAEARQSEIDRAEQEAAERAAAALAEQEQTATVQEPGQGV